MVAVVVVVVVAGRWRRRWLGGDWAVVMGMGRDGMGCGGSGGRVVVAGMVLIARAVYQCCRSWSWCWCWCWC